MALSSIAKCSRTLAPNASAAPLDVLKTKSVLKSLGHYDAPEWGLSPYPDPALFKAIADFQRANGLKADGVMKPDGETESALGQNLRVLLQTQRDFQILGMDQVIQT